MRAPRRPQQKLARAITLGSLDPKLKLDIVIERSCPLCIAHAKRRLHPLSRDTCSDGEGREKARGLTYKEEQEAIKARRSPESPSSPRGATAAACGLPNFASVSLTHTLVSARCVI